MSLSQLLFLSVLFVIIGFFQSFAFASPQSFPNGTWDVVGVKIDVTSSRTMVFSIDDPRLVGRSFTFSPTQILTNADEGGCENFELRKQSLSARDAFGAFGHNQTGRSFIPADFDLKFAPSKKVTLMQIMCDTGMGGGYYYDGVPLILVDNDKAFLGWNDLAVLELKKRMANAKPTPSFDCQKANAPAEKQICQSIDLANMDVSLSRAYGDTIDFLNREDPTQIELFKQSQNKWLIERADCGFDKTCIAKSYSKRIAEIIDFSKGAP